METVWFTSSISFSDSSIEHFSIRLAANTDSSLLFFKGKSDTEYEWSCGHKRITGHGTFTEIYIYAYEYILNHKLSLLQLCKIFKK